MRNMIILLFSMLLVASRPALAEENSPGSLLSLISMAPAETTQDKITSLLGKPATVEENKRKEWWHYSFDGARVTICWNKRTDALEKLMIENEAYQKGPADSRLKQLHSGSTDAAQVFNILGTPEDMTIRGITQEMHYSYQNCVLRLFFRNNKLVDFTLLGQR